MAYDALTMRAVVRELNDTLTGGRINRIYQPSRFDIVMQIHANGTNHRLLLSSHPQLGGVYLSRDPAGNPETPPMFCTLLRKHLEGYRIERIFQKDLERVMVFSCEGMDETGMPAQRWLIAEIMGKHSNIILSHPEEGPIIDSIRRISHQVSRVREILPGLPYVWPPPQHRADPLTASQEDFFETLRTRPDQDPCWKSLLSSYEGFGPLSAREVVHRARLDPDHRIGWLEPLDLNRLYESFASFWRNIHSGEVQPILVVDPQEKRALAYAPYPLLQFPTQWHQPFETMNALLDEYFIRWVGVDRLEESRNSLMKAIQQHIDRTRNRLAAIQESLLDAEKADSWRAKGEIILAQIHTIGKGDHTVTGPDYRIDPPQMETITLNPQKSPAENAQAYFRRYHKAKKSLSILSRQLSAAQEELTYLESIELTIHNGDSIGLLKEIRTELQEEGYLKEQRGKKRRRVKSEQATPPLELTDADGYRILIGRNNRQNDLVTMRLARSNDLWFHAKDIPGSHVIVQLQNNSAFDDAIISKAAGLAAYFSQARSAGKVPIDYTLRKYVRKPKGAKPGMVIYDHQKTVWATPVSPASLDIP